MHLARRRMLRYNAKSYRWACCRSEKAYFNFIIHIIPYTILTSKTIWICPYKFRKYRTYCELVKYGEAYELNSKWRPLVTKIYTILRKNGDISRTHECNSAKVPTTNQKFCRIRCTNIRVLKKSKGCDTAWQQDDERMSPFRNLSGVPKFKAIKRIRMFCKITVFAIQQNATHIWKWCLKFVLMVLPLFEKAWNEHTLAKMSNVTFKQNQRTPTWNRM